MSSNVKILTITSTQLDMFTRQFQTVNVKAETKPVRDQHVNGVKAHKASVVPDIALATATVAITNFYNKQHDKGEFVYSKRAHRFVHHGYARVIKVQGRTDSDMVTVSTTVTTSRETHNMTYSKPWSEWRALWRKYNEKYFKFPEKHTVVPADKTF